MNVSQYSPNKKMEHEAIGPLDSMPLISELMREAGVPGQRRLALEESFVRTCDMDVSGATLRFGIDEHGCAHVTRCTTTAAEVMVPAEVEGSVVAAIGPLAFKGCASLERIELPDTLHTIGRRAFQGTRLASLYIPESLRTVGSAAFYTGGAITRNYKPTIREVRIAPGNDRFYVEEETLCQRGDDGDIALLHVGAGKRMVVPANVTHIGAFAFMRADRVDQVVMHDGVKSIDLGGLDLARGVSALVYEQRGDDPRRYVIRYPLGELGRQTLRITLSHGGFDIALAFLECDRSITHVSDTYIRSRMMLDRLAEPVYLYERVEALFRNRLENGICQSVVAFGRNGYLEGVDKLLDLGLLNEGNIERVLDAAIEADEVALVSRLVEVRRTRFGVPLFDFDL